MINFISQALTIIVIAAVALTVLATRDVAESSETRASSEYEAMAQFR